MTLKKIVSGAQTGVDRAALDAAMNSSIEVGGWCPEGRLAEDGPIPLLYPVTELPRSGYRQRTKRNVIDSDGTAIIYFGHPTGGTELTIKFCMSERKPYALIDAEIFTVDQAASKICRFIGEYNIETLNLAGPRAGGEPRAYGYTYDVVMEVLTEQRN